MAYQLALLDTLTPANIVNVASVKHRSPLRYPGGKTWLVPRIFKWLLSLEKRPTEFLEPFCGGAIVGLTVAFEKLADHVTLVERDEQVGAIWQTIINDEGGAEWLASRIEEFEVTPASVAELFEGDTTTVRETAFRTIIQNRTNHGGILASGAGRIKSGEAGKGIASRWYPETLARRIRDIASIRERLTFLQGDGMAVLAEFADRADAVSFIDPPYTAGGKRAGSRLYNYSELDHGALFQVSASLTGDFLMTYDNALPVRKRAAERGFDIELIAMKNTHHAKMKELLIGRNLDWVR